MGRRRQDILEKKDLILSMIAENATLCAIAAELCCKQSTLVEYLKIMNIEYKGHQGKSEGKGGKIYKPAINYLYNGSTISATVLRLKLLKEGYKEPCCEICKLISWQGKDIPLELHHIDGNPYNNELTNLQIICPNCHAQTDNYCGRNIKVHEKAIIEKNAAKTKIKADKVARGKVRKDGIASEQVMTETEYEQRLQIILNSGADFTKYGWQSFVERNTDLTRRQISNTIKHYMDYFKTFAYIRE